ncbi:glycoside hydrolase family 27 protein [Paenibacillus sp. N4]|uniref:glycoside hydrolase family 27 protein n=1 Tax=Paenibacillus vietnamensis TaxID=2590547 RepID=UPI001CD17AB1|nr:glycoside hydrolase family 27 protein [Paenibacillus vietnamensis]MCA0757249.1 glycoside hydrolase family 27 protein [Paenibacillus vietnamensis]
MGWNSWDCYGASVTEAEVKGNADYMAAFLKPFGWEYVVVDIQWYEPGANSSRYRNYAPLEMDGCSRLIPAVNRFPSSAGGMGFTALADYVHRLGLKFGIHIMRGIPRQAVHANTPILGTTVRAKDIAHPNSICPWNTDMYGVDPAKPGAREYYNSLFDMYADWGVDFVKVDDIASSTLYGYHPEEILMIREAIDQCGRAMVLSLSPGPAPIEHADFFKANANMWRITNDFWDLWPHLAGMFKRCEQWAEYSGPGHWPDCDMLPLGRIGIRNIDGGAGDRWTRFSKDEQITMMTLWTIFRSPLMFGGELRNLDEWTLGLMTNPEVLAMHRNSRGARQLYRENGKIVWTSEDDCGNRYAALFNISYSPAVVTVFLRDIDIHQPVMVRDLWLRKDLGLHKEQLAACIPPHGAKLFRLFAPES